mmetsp:Transcript_14305/g.13888  ORF Transcript_14305/g.13888 Transcript_14305/m.13888 type:complete len:84 (-) Transcript_14305:281-532(-)
MNLYSQIHCYLKDFTHKEEMDNSISDFKVLKQVILKFTDSNRDIDLPLLYTIFSELVCKIKIATSAYSCKDLEATSQNKRNNN